MATTHQRSRSSACGYGASLIICEVCARVALLACELHEFGDLAVNLALFWCADDPDAAAGAHFKQPFIAQASQRAQGGVGVDSHYRGEVAGGW